MAYGLSTSEQSLEKVIEIDWCVVELLMTSVLSFTPQIRQQHILFTQFWDMTTDINGCLRSSRHVGKLGFGIGKVQILHPACTF